MEHLKDGLLLNVAIVFAANAHATQVDLVDEPYIYHVLRVMDRVRHLGVDYACVGVLHDVVEDCGVTLSDLYPLFPPQIGASVLAISHRHGERYGDYIERCCTDTIAREVKIADLEDHLSRMDGLPEETRNHLSSKYRWALIFLKAAREQGHTEMLLAAEREA